MAEIISSKIQTALRLLKKGKISMGKAAELSGVSVYEILELMKEYRISYGYTLEEFKKDIKRFWFNG